MSQLERREISAPRVGRFNVFIQGNLKQSHFVVLTVHDLGCNHMVWDHFVQHESMEEIRKRAAFIHVDVPGQEDGAPDLPSDYSFPSMQSLGEDLVCVLDQLDVKQVVCLGEGAGANIIARFAISQPTKILGICLIHCTGTTAGFMESLKDKIMNWKLEHIGMNPTAEAYLVLHRFGSGSNEFEKAENKEQLEFAIKLFLESLRSKINPRNLKKFVESFMNRSSISESLGKLKCTVLMMTGAKASFNHTVTTLYQTMVQKIKNRKNLELVELDGIANVVEESPDRLAESFLYLIQGLGIVGGVPMPRVRSQSQDQVPISPRDRSFSMDKADQPRGTTSMFGKMSTSPPGK